MKGTRKKTVTFEDQDQKDEEVEQNLGQESLSGEKVVDEHRRNYQQDPGQENLSGESGVEENVQGEKQGRIKFCPGSSDGLAERIKLIPKKKHAQGQILPLMTTRGIWELTVTQTKTRAQDRNCQR